MQGEKKSSNNDQLAHGRTRRNSPETCFSLVEGARKTGSDGSFPT
jgi:hypothetical protein